MDYPDKENLKTKIIRLVEKEFGNWLDDNESLLIQKIPDGSKIFPMLCGSMVEGFISKGSDLDFSLIIDDTTVRPRIRGKLSRAFKEFLNELNEKVQTYGLDHVCKMAYKIRTTSYLLEFENCKNPQFRVNYFLFGKLIHPDTKKGEVKRRLATFEDFIEFKKRFQERYRRKFGYKLFQVEKSVLTNPEGYGPKRIYRNVQLIINAFLMAYGLESKGLTEKMEDELFTKTLEIIKSTLMKSAQEKMKHNAKQALRKLLELKKAGKENSLFKRRRLKFFKENGIITDRELLELRRFLRFLLEFVYNPLENFYEVQIKLVHVIRDVFHIDIQWLGLRKDHAYITLSHHKKVKCLDIFSSQPNEFDVYAIISQETMRDRIDKNYYKLVEVKEVDSSLGIELPFKKHIPFQSKRGRIHFKLFSVKREEDLRHIEEKLLPLQSLFIRPPC